MEKKKIGVITEQGFAAGQFGYSPLNEQDRDKVETKSDENKENN